MSAKVAVVTGANKGVGYGIVRGLCKRFDGLVYLTSRDEERGNRAVADLKNEGLNPRYHQLDITDQKSIETFRDYIKKKTISLLSLKLSRITSIILTFSTKNCQLSSRGAEKYILAKKNHGGIDILVNNAAIAFKSNATEPVSVQAEETLRVNYFSVLNACEILFPIVRNGGRIVNVSSSAGHLENIPSAELRSRFQDPNLTIPQLSELLKKYIEAAKQGNPSAEWGGSSYAVSKVGLTALTMIQQRLLNDRDIKVNAVHPGYVDTDMSSHKGHLSIDEGAAAPLFLALDAPDSIKGQYVWHDKSIKSWTSKK